VTENNPELPWDPTTQKEVVDILRDAFELRRGFWWNMRCWNGLSVEQQERLLTVGNLPIDYIPEGGCPNGAEVAIETQWDQAAGPRFYCCECAVSYLYATKSAHRGDRSHISPRPDV
jgi:hypothetical protein